MLLPALLLMAAPTPSISNARLMATVRHLSTAYPTRNTSTPECRAAAEWVAGELRKIPGLQVELMTYHVEAGRRVPKALDVVQVVATLPGETTRRVMIGGHLDTIQLNQDPMTALAPGANDDASGVAATMETARVFAARAAAGMKPKNTMVFVAFTGEEQGLFGSTALAERAVKEGWTIDALLSNDTIGGGQGANGERDKGTVRIYSEESETHLGRELARLIEWETRGKIRGFRPRLVFRRDRFQRGGDHTPFN
ncbi:M20/M25/M40 family metallo-hydrolase, partial [bacterium]